MHLLTTETSTSILLATFCLGGCKQTHVRTPKISDVAVFSYPSELRGAYVRPKDSQSTVCAEPFSDTAVQTALNVASDITAKYAGVEAKVDNSVNATTEIVALAGRTQAVLITRELLYRICEAQLNGMLSTGEGKTLFEDALRVVTSVTKAEEQQAGARLATAKAEELNARATLEAVTRGKSLNACFMDNDTCVDASKTASDPKAAEKKCQEILDKCTAEAKQ